MTKLDQEFILACMLVLAGIVLIFLGFFTEPEGEISPSVLTAFGEILTFSGSIIGLDFNYKSKLANRKKDNEDVKKEDE